MSKSKGRKTQNSTHRLPATAEAMMPLVLLGVFSKTLSPPWSADQVC
ncbi:hypothetical protein APS_2140 [Acetobacter pasteurianus subsp. pasteurianus LMG 1262 = NBRC 106471]|nr:hypothetical protein APS_2140 [Acetobacter pasteurianus subsp. pasteurianus LMG 1262 = NBRC 106471]